MPNSLNAQNQPDCEPGDATWGAFRASRHCAGHSVSYRGYGQGKGLVSKPLPGNKGVQQGPKEVELGPGVHPIRIDATVQLRVVGPHESPVQQPGQLSEDGDAEVRDCLSFQGLEVQFGCRAQPFLAGCQVAHQAAGSDTWATWEGGSLL